MRIESNVFCPECGPDVSTDEDGCCAHCGATATGSAVVALARRLAALEKVAEKALVICDEMKACRMPYASDMAALDSALAALTPTTPTPAPTLTDAELRALREEGHRRRQRFAETLRRMQVANAQRERDDE